MSCRHWLMFSDQGDFWCTDDSDDDCDSYSGGSRGDLNYHHDADDCPEELHTRILETAEERIDAFYRAHPNLVMGSVSEGVIEDWERETSSE